MNPPTFRAFLNLLMASDPTPVSNQDDLLLVQFAHTEAESYGFPNWIVAYHEFDESTAKKVA